MIDWQATGHLIDGNFSETDYYLMDRFYPKILKCWGIHRGLLITLTAPPSLRARSYRKKPAGLCCLPAAL
jgi:hypothetical protein